MVDPRKAVKHAEEHMQRRHCNHGTIVVSIVVC